MKEDVLNKNIKLFYIYTLFNEPLFWGPILILCLQNLAHMSLPEIFFMEAIVLIISATLDVPCGIIADKIGRKKTVLIGRFFLSGSIVMFSFMTNPTMAWIGNILWAIGFSLQSGADSALLYDSLKENNNEHKFKEITGKSLGYKMCLFAFSALLTGYLASIDLRLPLLVGLPFTIIPIICVMLMKEPIKNSEIIIKDNILKCGLKLLKTSREVRWIILFTALLGMTSKIWFFTYNPYFELVKLPVENYGIIFFLLNIVCWISSHFAQKIENIVGERMCIILMVLCLGLPIILMASFPIEIFAYLVLVQNLVRGFMIPFIGGYINKHIDSNIRATMLSVKSSITNMVSMVGLAIFAVLLKEINLLPALLSLGVVTILLGLMCYRSYVKINKDT